MNINTSCPIPIFSSVLVAAAKSPVENLLEQAAAFKKEGEEKALALQDVSDRKLFLRDVQSLYKMICDTTNVLSAKGVPFAEIRERVERETKPYREQLDASWNRFKAKEALFNDASSRFSQAASSPSGSSNDFVPPQVTLKQRKRNTLEEDFARLSLSGATPAQRMAEDPLWAFKRDRMAQNMATAQIGAYVAHAVGTVVKVTAKAALGCYSFDSRVRQVCQANIHFVKKAGKAALEAIGAMKVLKFIATPPPVFLQELQRQYLIPQDEAAQYYHNSLTTTVSLIPVPPVLRWVKMASKPKTTFSLSPEAPRIFEAEWHEVVERPKLPAPRPSRKLPDVKARVTLDKNVPSAPTWRETELALFEEIKPQVRAIESMPAGLPTDLRTLHSQCQMLEFPLNPGGRKMLGHVPYIKTLDKALFVIERATNSPRVAKMAGSDVLIESQGAYHFVDRIVDQMIEASEKMGVKELYVAFDKERLPVLTAVTKRSDEVVAIGSFYAGVNPQPLTLIQIQVRVEPKPVASSSLRYPEVVVRDIDRAVSGKKSLHLYNAIIENDAELLLPQFVNERGQEQLWLDVISKYHAPLTREARVEYFSSDSKRLVAKVTDRGRSFVVTDRPAGHEIVQRLKGIDFLRSKNLPSIGMPSPIACGRYVHNGLDRYFLITHFVNDLTFEETFLGIGHLDLGSDVRKAELASLNTSSHFLGKGLAELQTTVTKPNSLELRINSDIGNLEELIRTVDDDLVDIGMRGAINFESSQALFDTIKTDYRKAPGLVSYGFGGYIAASQFARTNASKPFVSLIDADFVTEHVSVSGQPLEPVCKHYYNMLHMFSRDGLANGLTLAEVMQLQLSFATGYSSVSSEIFPTGAAHFYDLYYSLDAIRDLAEDLADGKSISKETLGTLIGEVKQKLSK